MKIIEDIINAILSALGLGPKQETAKIAAKPKSFAKPKDAELSAQDKEEIKARAVQGLEDVEGAENIHVHGTGENTKILISRDGADLVEEDGEAQWVNRVVDDVPRDQLVDDWGPLPVGPSHPSLNMFVFHEMVFDHTRSKDPILAEKKLQELGYRDAGHWFKVRATAVCRMASQTGPNAGDAVFQSQSYMDAGLQAAGKMRQLEEQAVIAANPELLAPIEGVSVNRYAQISARQAQGLDQPGLMALLAENNLDYATWEKASGGWMDRMRNDTTATISSIYGKAFMSSGQGQFGDTAQQVAGSAYAGKQAGGAEPIPYEKNCEIAGAMQAWSESGQDVNAMLQSTFGMNAMDYSAASTWWFTQLTADMKRFDDYSKQVEEYKKKYLGGAAKAASDIEF